MPTSDARIQANQANAMRSTGPKTVQGKSRSRENSLKHGLTGGGVVLPADEAAEVAEIERDLVAELKPSSRLGRSLVHRLALGAVRMERCEEHERAIRAEHVGRILDEFDAEWPAVDGVEDPDRDRAWAHAKRFAQFDTSKEACLARKYEAAAERGFFRSLKELRIVEKAARKAESRPEAATPSPALGSFFQATQTRPKAEPKPIGPAPKAPSTPSRTFASAPLALPIDRPPYPGHPFPIDVPAPGSFDLGFSIGRAG